jgi:hypothetical protein
LKKAAMLNVLIKPHLKPSDNGDLYPPSEGNKQYLQRHLSRLSSNIGRHALAFYFLQQLALAPSFEHELIPSKG